MNDRGVPAGTGARALQLAAGAARLLDSSVDAAAVDSLLTLPFSFDHHPTLPGPPQELGGGALCVDLGPDDHETWTTFREVTASDLDPESVARRAQVWRLPVVPYRHRRAAPGVRAPAVSPCGVAPSAALDLRGVHVVDLTSIWAGPLCTWLLAEHGARVVKVEPQVRPDGLRFGDGDSGLGDAPMYRALNHNKDVVDIDLRRCAARREFDRLVRSADLVIDSLSIRARSNLGLDAAELRRVNPRVKTLSITAFDARAPEAAWVAYGTGVHALSGLGDVSACVGEPAFAQPAYSYPDPLGGLLAFERALQQLVGIVAPSQLVSLQEAISPIEGVLEAGSPGRDVSPMRSPFGPRP